MAFNQTDILIGAVGVMGTMLGFVIKINADQAIKKLDEIVNELKQQRQITTIHGQDIKYLKEQGAIQSKRLNRHSELIRQLEIHTKTPPPNHIET